MAQSGNTDNGNYLIYTIFEKDNWPTGIRYSGWVRVPGASAAQDKQLGFRSNDGEWIAHYISSNNADSYHVTNGCIRSLYGLILK